MLTEFRLVWDALQSIIAALPNDIISVSSYVFCIVGLVGFLRSM